MIDRGLLLSAAETITRAVQEGHVLPPFENQFPDCTAEEAYRIQEETAKLCVKSGQRIAGYKIAYAGERMRKLAGISEPCFGYIPSGRVSGSGSEIPCWGRTNLKAEPEILFILGRDLRGPNVTIADALLAVDYMAPAFEIVSPIFQKGRSFLTGEIAGNMSFGALVVGSVFCGIGNVDLGTITVTFLKNGTVLSRALSGTVMRGNPLNSVAFLANRLSERGGYLKKGDMILSGSPAEPAPIKDGDTLEAEFSGIGKLSVRVIE